MGTGATKPTAVFALLLGVWVGTYWLYDPGPPKISFARAPSGPEASPGAAGASGTVVPAPPPASPPRTSAPAMVEVTGVEAPRFTSYTVQTGDTSLAIVARRTLGDPRYAEAIARANPLISPSRLIPGRTVLRIPVDVENIQGKVVTLEVPAPVEAEPGAPTTGVAPVATASVRTHVVQEGETLSSIAAKYYGSGAAYGRVFAANRDVLRTPDRVKLGMVLKVPE